MQEHFYESGNCVHIICAILGVHPIVLSVFGKGKVRMLLLGWSVSMVVVFCTIYMFQMD